MRSLDTGQKGIGWLPSELGRPPDEKYSKRMDQETNSGDN
jgi:hypothetical protein